MKSFEIRQAIYALEQYRIYKDIMFHPKAWAIACIKYMRWFK